MISINKKAPAFSLADQNGKMHSLEEYAGGWVLIYFYPKDDTPGCTKEACGLRDVHKDYKDAGIQVLGVSKDSVTSHKKFEEKYGLPFTLLSDESTKTIEEYGAWAEKSMFGKKYMGTLRISYLIDPKGIVVRAYEKVKPANHAAEVLHDVKELSL
jgi:peroxiredoxin Q/BCP